MKQEMNLKIDLRLVCVLLLIVIAVMLGLWRPWQTKAGPARKITISGTSTIKAEPDEFQFTPYYERTTAAEITTLSQQVVDKLKALGVADTDIKTSANSYDTYNYYPTKQASQTTLTLTITIHDKTLAQKVQDYLLTTTPKGQITPYNTFSTDKQKSLETEARQKAIEDARTKADQTASGLKTKIGKVIEVSDGNNSGFPCGGGYCPMATDISSAGSADTPKSLTIQPGQNEFNFTVTVSFELN